MLNLAISSPREAGFDEEMFSRVSGLLNAAVEKKEIPGAVAAVARHGFASSFWRGGSLSFPARG